MKRAITFVMVMGFVVIVPSFSFSQSNASNPLSSEDITVRYNMTAAQIEQYKVIDAEHQQKIAALKSTSGLSKKAFNDRQRATFRDFRSSLEKILTPQQVALLQKEQAERAAISAKTTPILNEYRKERAVIKTQIKIVADRTEPLAQLDKKYEARLAAIIGTDRAAAMIKDAGEKRNLNTQDAKTYNLSYLETQEYKRIEREKEAVQQQIDNTPMTTKERREKTKLVADNTSAQIKGLLGENRYRQWNRDKRDMDQQLKKHLGLSDQQLQLYKNIQNNKAIEIAKIRKSNEGTEQEKQMKIEQLKADADQQIQQMLSPEQRNKMASNRQKAFNSARRNAIRTHTVRSADPQQQPSAPK